MKKDDNTITIEDLKEQAPCGMIIHYCVDKITDFVTYADINERGKNNRTEKCNRCSWFSICKPTYPDTPELSMLREKVFVYEDTIRIYVERMKLINSIVNLVKDNSISAKCALDIIESTLVEKELLE